MKSQSFLRRPKIWRVGLILLAIIASLTAGAFTLVWDSPLAPLVVGGAAVTAAIGIASLQNPVWALYALVFINFLPAGLIPMHAILSHMVLLLALFSWLLDAGFRRRRIVWTSTSLLMVCFLIWGLVTLSWAPNLVYGRRELVQCTINLVLYLILIVNEVDSLQTLDGLMKTLALNGWVLVLAGIGTVLLQGYEAGTRLMVLEMNENLFGLSLIVTMSGVLWHTMRSSRWQKALRMSLSFIFILLALMLVALSGSRGSAISLLATLLAFWFWKPTRLWGKLGLLILAVAIISAPFVFSTLVNRFLDEEGPMSERLLIWQATRLLIRDHFWRGVGIGNGSYATLLYLTKIAGIRWHSRERMSAHNPIIEVWADVGLPGVLLYLGVLGSAVWLFVRHYLRLNRTGVHYFASYFALVSCVFSGYMLSWIKGGGLRIHPTYLLLLALLLIPSRLDVTEADCVTKNRIRNVGR